MPTQQPPASATSRKGIHFADSVRRVEDEPCAARVSGLTSPVLVVMMASLAYLMETLQVRFRPRRAAGSWLQALVHSTRAIGYPFGSWAMGPGLPSAHADGAGLCLAERCDAVECSRVASRGIWGSQGLSTPATSPAMFPGLARGTSGLKGFACPHAHACQEQVLLLVYFVLACGMGGAGRRAASRTLHDALDAEAV